MIQTRPPTIHSRNTAWGLTSCLLLLGLGCATDKTPSSFDPPDEVVQALIEDNEFHTVQACLAIVDAQREYADKDLDGNGVRNYASQFLSDPGLKNGLYWYASEGKPSSPLAELAAVATAEGYKVARAPGQAPRPFHGYYFKMLNAQGPHAPGGAISYVTDLGMTEGFGTLAYPAEYGRSGVMTFIVNHHGIVYESDLGPDTSQEVTSIRTYDPGPDWRPVTIDSRSATVRRRPSQ